MEISKLCQVSVFDWIIPSNKQQTLYRLLYFCSRFLPSYRSRLWPSPAPCSPGLPLPCLPPLVFSLEILDSSDSNFPPQPGKIQIPHPPGKDDSQTPVGLPERVCWSFELIGTLETLYSGQFTLSTQLIKPNYLVIPLPTTYRSFSRNLPPLLIFL